MLPRAPKSRNSTDFIVEIFVLAVATILVIFSVAAVIGGLRGDDVGSFVGVLTDIVTTIVGALIGFIAGKGQGRIEERDERDKDQT